MGTFNSTKTVPYVVDDLTPVSQDLMRYFESQDYEATETHLPAGGVQVSIRKGGTFKAIVGMKTALNIRIEPVEGGTQVNAGIGIFGQQVIPTLITSLVFWPILITQVAGMVQSAKLDDEALQIVEAALRRHAPGAQIQPPQPAAAPAAASAGTVPVAALAGSFCSECGARLGPGAKFCSQCG